MAFVEWEIKAKEFGNCNCAYGCPCQFNALPTNGDCMAVVGIQVDEGHFGQTRLDGLKRFSLRNGRELFTRATGYFRR